jgi:hypothetical protein
LADFALAAGADFRDFIGVNNGNTQMGSGAPSIAQNEHEWDAFRRMLEDQGRAKGDGQFVNGGAAGLHDGQQPPLDAEVNGTFAEDHAARIAANPAAGWMDKLNQTTDTFGNAPGRNPTDVSQIRGGSNPASAVNGMPYVDPVVVGKTADGGLVWNTGAVSYPVDLSIPETRPLPSVDSGSIQSAPGYSNAFQIVEQPTYDALGNVTGTELVRVDNSPIMSYGDQMKNALPATGQIALGGLKGIINGVPAMVTTIGKGYVYLGAQIGEATGIMSPGTTPNTINALDPVTGRVFDYSNGLQAMGGVAGEALSPGAYAKGAQVGVEGLRVLGPTLDAMLNNYLQRIGDMLNAAPELGATERMAARPAFSGDWNNFKTLGITDSPMLSSEGRAMVNYLESQGYDRAAAVDRASELMNTGSSRPLANPVETGDTFYKLVPSGSRIGPASPYWMTQEQLSSLNNLNAEQIGSRLGLPLAQQTGSFDLYSIRALTPNMSFTSTIAPTEELGAGGVLWCQPAGGEQTLLLNRNLFSNPTLVQPRRF